MNNIDINKLRNDLFDYYGVSMFSVSGFAVMDLIRIEQASSDELINIAIEQGFDLNKYLRNKMLIKRL